MKKVIVYGQAFLSKMLYYDARGNENFQIACFTADAEYLENNILQQMPLPLVSFQEIRQLYPPEEYDMLALFDESSRMRERGKMYLKAKESGYRLRNYVSARADFAPDVVMGENNVIMGNTHIGMGGIMGNNNLIRQNVYLGHEFVMGNNNMIIAGCTIGGECRIKDNCFIGLGATIRNRLTIETESLIGAGSVVVKDTEPYSKNIGNPSRIIGYHREEGLRM